MTIPAVGGTDETKPAGSRKINLGDNDIREHKTQVRQIMEIDHEYPSSGQSVTAGQHKQVTLQEQADLGTGAVDATILGSQTVSGVGELVYTTEADADIQITSVAGINAAAMTGVYAAANVASLATMMNLIYPVGSQYVNYTVATNPGTLLGVGTWVAVTEKVTVGIGGAGIFSTLTTGGAKTIDIEHNHGAATGDTMVFTSGSVAYGAAADVAHTHDISNDLSTTQSIVQEFRTAYVWERTF